MFEIKEDIRMTTTEKLLFNLVQEVKILNDKLIDIVDKKVDKCSCKSSVNEKENDNDIEYLLNQVEPSEEIAEVNNLEKEEKKVYACKHCGGEHDRPLDIANCGRNKNKKGENK